MIRTVYIRLLVMICFSGVSMLAAAQSMNVFHIQGKVVCNKADANDIVLMVINGDTNDTSHVSLDKGKFDLVLSLNTNYLLLAMKKDQLIKQILIDADAPATTEPYEMKLTLNMTGSTTQLGIIRYHSGRGTIGISPLRRDEVRMYEQKYQPFTPTLLATLKKIHR